MTDLPLNFLKNADDVIQQQALGAATSLIEYHSAGRCLVIADEETLFAMPTAPDELKLTWLVQEQGRTSVQRQLTDIGIAVFRGADPIITGHLGNFRIDVLSDGKRFAITHSVEDDGAQFDLVLDLSEQPLCTARLAPFGYRHATISESTEVDALWEELAGLLGEFEKPRYFDYDESLCAHSRSKLSGCNACIDICATEAITSHGDTIVVDPYLCQGCGTCATVCPSGAMTYAYPRAADAISRVRALKADSPGKSVLLLHKHESEQQDEAFEAALPKHVLAVAVEEVTAFGIDFWSAMCASGFSHVGLVAVSEQALATNPDWAGLKKQAALLETIIGPLISPASGQDQTTTAFVQFIPVERLNDSLATLTTTPRQELPAFATHNRKRTTFRDSIDTLISHAEHPVPDAVDLPEGSPFGQIKADTEKCTLCMACVSTCPAGALLDGQDQPRLRFIEANCVQCGLCETACPESAISRHARFLYSSLDARQTVTLHEEEPFNCIRCHKPFATRRMMETLTGKLSGHWMFENKDALRRIQMCEDCRVIDIFEKDESGIEVHRDPRQET